MKEIKDNRIKIIGKHFQVFCKCGALRKYSSKSSALRLLERGTCKDCKIDYRDDGKDYGIYKNKNNKWCSKCSKCGKIQEYSRKTHAKNSELNNWKCKKCSNNSRPQEDLFIKYYKIIKNSAIKRGIYFNISEEYLKNMFTGYCNLSGIEIEIKKQQV